MYLKPNIHHTATILREQSDNHPPTQLDSEMLPVLYYGHLPVKMNQDQLSYRECHLQRVRWTENVTVPKLLSVELNGLQFVP